MVGFKNRYMVMEVFLDPNKDFSVDEPIIITQYNLSKAIKDSILTNFGECGLASSMNSFQVKYVNPIMKICIFRTSREEYQKVWAAITMVKSIGNCPVVFNLLDLSVHAYHPTLAVTNIRSLVPLMLDGDSVQYNPWATLFRNTAKVYQVLDHIDPKVKRSADIEDELWDRLDAVVLQWIYDTISTDFLYRILDEKATAMVSWDKLRDLFQDNKRTRVVHLENQFGLIDLESSGTLSNYCQRMKTVSDQLAAIGHPISEERLVLQLAGKLTSEYAMVATLIQQGNPIPSFAKACSMLELDRVSREKNKRSTASSSTVLLAAAESSTTNSGGSSGGGTKSGGSGSGKSKNNKKNKGHKNSGAPKQQQQQQNSGFFWPWAYYPPSPFPSQPPQWRGASGQQQQQPPLPPSTQPGLLGPAPRNLNAAAFLAPTPRYQHTSLPAMFNTISLQAPDPNWYMDTGATSHLMNDSGSPNGVNYDEVQ